MTPMPEPSTREIPDRAFVCLGVTDVWHPWCEFETTDRDAAREHGKLDGHYCVDPQNKAA